uniref:Reverse transcriptase domain-containing protein n=1 Tax=Tanacetum cinerariifolium TaxID=118510 RepID=A0A6L2NHR0_TANCI|nr:hypothetical protein [Tanacetum cinerariifolium]
MERFLIHLQGLFDPYQAIRTIISRNHTSASPDYSSATPGNTSFDFETEFDPSEDPSEDRSVPLAITSFPNDPCMQIRQAYYATNEESSDSSSSFIISPPPAPVCPHRKARLLQPYEPQPFMQPFRYHPNGMTFIHMARKRVRAPRAPIASPPVLPLPPTTAARQPTILTLMTRLERHEEQINVILNHLDEFPLKRIEKIKYDTEGLDDGRREKTRHDDEVVLTRVRISTLEVLIEDIQVTMALLPPGFLEPLYPGIMDMINAQDIEHMIIPTPPRDTEPPVGSPIPSSPSSMAPKRKSTSAAPTMTQAAIKKLVADSVAAALEAQAAIMENTDNTNRNIRESETTVARKCSYKEFISCNPFYFKGTEGAVGLIR